MSRYLPAAAALMLGLLMLGAAACSSAAVADPTPVATWKITPASGTFAAASPASAATAASTAPVSTSGGAGATLRIKAVNLLFEPTTLTAAPGAVSIELDNADGGVPHNIQFFQGADAKGTSIGKTDIVTGPATSKLTLTVSAGSYFFQCDVHPTTMKGTLKVQ